MVVKRAAATLIGGLLAFGSGVINVLGLTGPVEFLAGGIDWWSTLLLMGGRFLAPELGLEQYQTAMILAGVLGLVGFAAVRGLKYTHEWLDNE